MQISARRSPSLAAAIQVMSTMPSEVAKQTNKYSKSVIVPEWTEALKAHAPLERMFFTRLVNPSTVYVSKTGVRLVAGKGDLVKQTEFGATREAYRRYRRGPFTTKKGVQVKRHNVKRRTQRQFFPNRREGYVVYPSASEMIPRIAALWVQTIYRTVHEGIEKIG